jgi:DNA polymerase-1
MLFCGTDIKTWKDAVIKEVREEGGAVVTTLDGFQRHLPDLVSSDVQTRRKAERQVVNTLVQGTAADLLKRCIFQLHNNMDPKYGRIVMIRHDEIVLEVSEMYKSQVRDILEETMTHCCPEYHIPFTVDIT